RQSTREHGDRADGRRLRYHHLARVLPRAHRLRAAGRALCARRRRHRAHRRARLRISDRRTSHRGHRRPGPGRRRRRPSPTNRGRTRPVNANTDTTGAALPPDDGPSPATLTTRTHFPTGSRRERPGGLALTIGFGLVAVCLAGLFTSPSAAVGGAWCIAMMLVLLFLSVPVAIALSVPSIIGVYAVS